MKKLSVIILVYNTSKYLDKCFKSVLEQDYTELEVILVNDCSTDNSGEICDEYAKKDSRVRVVHLKVNGGEGVARNAGVDNSTGDYITFLDSDDWIVPNTYKRLIDVLEKYDFDIIQGKLTVDFDSYLLKSKDTDKVISFSNEEALTSLLKMTQMTAFMWDKIYKKECYDGLRFSNIRSGCDTEIMFLLFCKVKKIGFMDTSFWHYIQRSDSLTTDKKPSREIAEFSIDLCERRIAYFKENIPSLVNVATEKLFTRCMGVYYNVDENMNDYEGFIKDLKEKITASYNFIKNTLSPKKKIQFKLLYMSSKDNVLGKALRVAGVKYYQKRTVGRGVGLKKIMK